MFHRALVPVFCGVFPSAGGKLRELLDCPGRVEPPEKFARLLEVRGDLGTQFFRAAKLSLLPQPLPEAYLQRTFDKPGVKIKQVAFNADTGACSVEGGPKTHIGRGTKEASGRLCF